VDIKDPFRLKEPVIDNDPESFNDIYYVILISIKLPFLYNPPSGTPAAAAAVSSKKFKEEDT
jgi:hypothetical protein